MTNANNVIQFDDYYEREPTWQDFLDSLNDDMRIQIERQEFARMLRNKDEEVNGLPDRPTRPRPDPSNDFKPVSGYQFRMVLEYLKAEGVI